jgi:hypothetical protein
MRASAAKAASGGYTATWILLSHSGTLENQTRSTENPDAPLLRSAAAHAKPPGNWKCYHPPGDELTSVLSNAISPDDSTVTNFGMTLTVAHNVACNTGPDDNKKDMFHKIVHDLTTLDTLAKVKYEKGGQVVLNPIQDKTIFMHPMPTDAHGTKHDETSTGRNSRTAAGLIDYFPGLGLYLLEVYDTDTGRPVHESRLDPLLVPYILGRRCNDSIHAITAKPPHRAGISRGLFDTLRENGLPQYYLDGRFRSETPSAKNHVSDFEIFRGKNSIDIQTIMSNNCSLVGEDEYNLVMMHYAAGVATKRIPLFELKKVCKLLSPPGTLNFELFDIGCRDPYPNPPPLFSVSTATWPPYKYSDDTTGSTVSISTFPGDLNTPPDSPKALRGRRIHGPPRFIGPHPLTSRQQDAQQAAQQQAAQQQAAQQQAAQQQAAPQGKRGRSSRSPPQGKRGRSSRSPPPPHGGKKTKTRRVKRNKSLIVQNKSRFRRTRRRVIKRKNN